jgi:hypothetical protein
VFGVALVVFGVSAMGVLQHRARLQEKLLFPVIAGLLIVAYLCFTVVVGGGWMEWLRLLVPVFPLVMLLAGIGLSRIINNRLRFIAVLSIIALQFASIVDLSRDRDSTGISAKLRKHTQLKSRWWRSSSLPLWDAPIMEPGLPGQPFSWFERANLVTLRDFQALRVLDEIVERARKNDPDTRLSIWTGQMGFIPYHLARRHPEFLVFHDLAGLTDRRYNCIQNDQILPGSGDYLARADHCGVPPADILYMLVPPKKPATDPQWVDVYRKNRHRRAAAAITGRNVRIYTVGWIRIRRDLFDRISAQDLVED